jgi:hypothetical protein
MREVVTMHTRLARIVAVLAIPIVGCSDGSTDPRPEGDAAEGARIVNAYASHVDVLVDGVLTASAVPPGSLDSVALAAGTHTVGLRPTGTTHTASVQIETSAGALRTVVALRWGATISASTIEDTNAVVPAGATKVRVLHLAPQAGEIEVARTQPDWLSPPLIGWKQPFLYDSTTLNDPLANPYYQSTVGTWDVRAWMKPSEDALGWDSTTARITFALASGEKRTVLVLDKPGGGIVLKVIE